MSTNNFRYDINGLRAYAVVLVVLFHFGVSGFSAGFIGVDIFFVISGFLMTSIVIAGLEKGSFSPLRFYLARAIRILPALVVLCIVLLVLGWFLLLPSDYQALAKHTFSSTSFISNLVYWKESGYFDVASSNKALLHTWSLSVEWQFYLLFPLVVACIYKLQPSRKILFLFFLIGTLISLIFSIYCSKYYVTPGFYFLPSRGWELLLGGLVFFVSKEKVPFRKLLEILGFLLIAISCYVFSVNTPWPSYPALLPTLGTCFILLAHQQDSYFTKARLFQWLGDNSYSIYLWHWPVIFLINYFNYANNKLYIVLGLVLSLILGHISYRMIENPTRRLFIRYSLIKSYFVWGSSVVVLSTVCFAIFSYNGITSRFPIKISQISEIVLDKNPRTDECLPVVLASTFIRCQYGHGEVKLIVIGDSHANAMINGIKAALPKDTSLLTYTVAGCPTVIGIKRVDKPKYSCGEMVKRIIHEVKSLPSNIPILVVNRVNSIFEGEPDHENINVPIRYVLKPHQNYDKDYTDEMQKAYVQTLGELAKSHQVVVTRPTPEAKTRIPDALAKSFYFGTNHDNLRIYYSEYMARSQSAWKAQDLAVEKYKIRIIDLSKFFCDEEYCYFTKNGIPLLYDDDHMSWTASLMLTPIFKQAIFAK